MRFLTIVFCLVIQISCRESIDWKTQESEHQLVVQAEVTNRAYKQYVALTKTQGYYDSSEPVPVSGASVYLSFENREIEMVESVFPGLYINITPIPGREGIDYTLTIDLDEPIGAENHFASQATMLTPYQIDSIDYFVYDPAEDGIFNYESRVYFTVYGSEPAEIGNFYQLEVFINSENSTPTVDDVGLWDDYWFNGLYEVSTTDFGFFQPIHTGDTLTLRISAIEEQYYDYVQDIKFELTGKDPFGFVGGAANVRGNISVGAVGYFRVLNSSEKSIIVQ